MNKNNYQQIEEYKMSLSLYDGSRKDLSYSEITHIDGIGNIMKTDLNLKTDFITNKPFVYFERNDNKILYDELNLSSRIKHLYTEISENGELLNIKQHDTYNGDYSVMVYTNKNKLIYVSPNLILSPVFKSFYQLELASGAYYHNSIELNNNEKQMRTEGVLYTNAIKKPVKLQTYKSTYNKKYTYGIEIETISGLVPFYVSALYDFDSTHDGSLRDKENNNPYGKEYVTGVLSGDNGLLELKGILNILQERCLLNAQCGNHFHFGGITFDKLTVVLMYYLYSSLQDEIFTMLPVARRKSVYCKKIPDMSISLLNLRGNNYEYYLNYYYNKIYSFVLHTEPSAKANRKLDHPMGHKCRYNHQSSRYSWVNFVTALCNTRGNGVYTVEFRPVPGTLSYKQNKMWLLIFMALVDVVVNNKQEILTGKITKLTHVIDYAYGYKSTVNEIHEFISERKETHNIKKHSIEDLYKIELDEYNKYEIDNNLTIKGL